jgi:hypothetical protein
LILKIYGIITTKYKPWEGKPVKSSFPAILFGIEIYFERKTEAALRWRSNRSVLRSWGRFRNTSSPRHWDSNRTLNRTRSKSGEVLPTLFVLHFLHDTRWQNWSIHVETITHYMICNISYVAYHLYILYIDYILYNAFCSYCTRAISTAKF